MKDLNKLPRQRFTVSVTVEVAPTADIEEVATQMGCSFEHPDIIWASLNGQITIRKDS